jgi:hypothetical protein
MSSFERKLLKNGKPNPKYVDLLDEDPPIPGQKFGCFQFISPEKLIKDKNLFFFEEFVKSWDFIKSVEKFSHFMHFISYKYNLKMESLNEDLTEFLKDERDNLVKFTVEDDYKTFLDKREDELHAIFQKEHQFQTSTRGFKSSGHFPSQEEAENYCKKLHEINPTHDIFVGPVGNWIPLDPDAYKTGRVEFMEEELNQLHHEKLKNEEKAKQEFEKRKLETKRKAIEENVRQAKLSGNKLTQTIDEGGNLTGVKETINFEEREVASADIQEEIMKESLKKFQENNNEKA